MEPQGEITIDRCTAILIASGKERLTKAQRVIVEGVFSSRDFPTQRMISGT